MKEKKKTLFSTIVVSVMAAIFIVVSVLILFVPQVGVKDICYFICGLVVVLGIYMIVRYFMTSGYERLNEYGFSEGVLFVLLGICGLVSADRIALSFLTALGILLLLSGVIKLQYALDLKCMEDRAWIGFFLVTILLLGCSVSVILNPFQDVKFYQNYTAYVMLADGVAEIVNILYLNIRTRAYQKEMEKAQREPEHEKEPKKVRREPEYEKEPKRTQREPEYEKELKGTQREPEYEKEPEMLQKKEIRTSSEEKREETGKPESKETTEEL